MAGEVTCSHCNIIVQNIGTNQCRDFIEESLVKYSKSEVTIPEYILVDKEEEEQIMIAILAMILSATLVSLVLMSASIWWCWQTGKGGDRQVLQRIRVLQGDCNNAT